MYRHRCACLVRSFILAAVFIAVAAFAQGRPSAATLPPGSPELIQPQELLKTIQSGGAKPLVLYVGPRFLYAHAHIRGAEFIGPASEPASLAALRKRIAGLAKTSPIVLYCGCCPWEHCPNIRPAFQELQKNGFTAVKALYLATSFGTDWVDRGYPVEKGASAP